MPRVTFLPSGRSVAVVRGASLLRAVLRARLPLARSCRGVGVCALCNVRVTDGEGGLAPIGDVERALMERAPLPQGQRYACLSRVVGDVTITTSYW